MRSGQGSRAPAHSHAWCMRRCYVAFKSKLLLEPMCMCSSGESGQKRVARCSHHQRTHALLLVVPRRR